MARWQLITIIIVLYLAVTLGIGLRAGRRASKSVTGFVAGDRAFGLLVMYFIFFGMLGMALGAAESGHPYSAIGVMRGLAQNTASELPFVLSVLALVAQYKTLSVTGIVAAQQGGFANWTVCTNPLAVIAAMLAFIGMMHRSPFDIHLAPQEIPVGPPILTTVSHTPQDSRTPTQRRPRLHRPFRACRFGTRSYSWCTLRFLL